MAEIALVELKEGHGRLAQQAFAIYEASFPVEERDSVENLVELIQRSASGELDEGTDFRFLVGVADEQIVALSIYTYHARLRMGYLWYLAITAVSRGQGLGSWMFSQTMNRLAREGGQRPLGMCWEVERPSDLPDPDHRDLAERRIRFYERNGSVLFANVDLLTPALGEGLPEVSYHLMYYPLVDEPTIPTDRVQAIIDVILLDNYEVDPDSEYYRRAAQSIGK